MNWNKFQKWDESKAIKSMSEERLINSINESEPVKESEKNFGDARIEKIKKDFYWIKR